MKKILLYAIVLLTNNLHAQIQGTDVFLQGNYVEIGMNACGAFGSSTLPIDPGPLGPYHANTAATAIPLAGIGLIADSDQDGWTDYCGDYFVPGSPVEGWSLDFDGNSYINSDQFCFYNDIAGSITGYTVDCGASSATWEGSVNGMSVVQEVVLGTNDLFFTINVTLCNTTGSVMTDVYWGRNVDPDNDAQQYGDYNTINTIESQATSGDASSLVTAVGSGMGPGCALALQSYELNSGVSYGGFNTISAANYYPSSGVGFNTFTVGSTDTANVAVSLGFYWPTINPGECVTASMQYVLSNTLPPPLPPMYVCADIENLPPDLGPFYPPGGPWTFVDIPLDGATLDLVTGAISGAVLGNTYTIQYDPPGACIPVSFEVFATDSCCNTFLGVLGAPTVTEFCIDSPATASVGPFTLVGQAGDIYTSLFFITNPSGSILEYNTTGIFNNLTIGDYCVYTINYNPSSTILPIGGVSIANYPNYDTLFAMCNTEDNIEKPGYMCASITGLANCIPIKVINEKNAGLSGNINLCNNVTDSVNLYSLLTGEDIGGVWIETSPIPSVGTAFNQLNGTFSVQGQAQGIYTFEYTIDADDPCSDPSTTVSVNVTQVPSSANAGIDYSACSLAPYMLSASLPIYGTGEWTIVSGPPGITLDNYTDPNATASFTMDGMYELVWGINNGDICPTRRDTMVIHVANYPSVTFDLPQEICILDTLVINYIGNGITVDNFNWNFDWPTYQAGYGDGPFELAYDGVGVRNITLTTTTGPGCSTDTSVLIDVLGTQVNTIADTHILYGEYINLNTVISPVDMPVIVSWYPNNYMSCSDCLTPDVAPLETTTYYVSIVDTNGCTSTDVVTIFVDIDREIFLPNAFSPDGDGLNDIWEVFGRNISTIDYTIYNRWGEKVYEALDSRIGWDGSYHDKKLTPGVYVFYVNITYIDGFTIQRKGNITLLK